MRHTPKSIRLIRYYTLLAVFCAAATAVGEETPFKPAPLFSVVTEERLCIGLRFSPAPVQIWTSSLDCWDISTGNQRDTAKMRLPVDQKANDGPVSMDLSADGKTIVTGNLWSRVVRVWCVPSQRVIRQITPPNGARKSGAYAPSAHFVNHGTAIGVWSPDTRTVLFGKVNKDKADRFISLSAPDAPGILAPSGALLALLPKNEQRVVLWDIENDKEAAVLQHDTNVWSVAFSPDGQHIATGARDNTVRIWRTGDGTQLELKGMKGHGKGALFLPTGVWALTFSRCGKLLASGGQDGCVNVWDLRSQQSYSVFHITTKPIIMSVAFSADSSLLAAGYIGAKTKYGMCVWKMPSREQENP